MNTNVISQEVTEFLVAKGIAHADQHPDYRLEIAYRIGYTDALRNYGIWLDGEQKIGCMNKPLKDI